MSKEYILRDEEALPLMDVLDNANIPLLPHSPEVQQLWHSYMTGLANVIEGSVPRCSVTIHSLTKLNEAKKAIILNPDTIPESVTLDSYDIEGHFPLQLSRHFKLAKWQAGEQIGIGKRPGSPGLEAQFAAVKEYAGGTEVVLYEDDIFTGTTAKFVMDELAKRGVNVSSFIAGIGVFDKAADPRIKAVHEYSPGDIHEIADPRDFLMGSYQGGLVTEKGTTLMRVPYIYPHVNLTDRASVPEDKVMAFSKAVLGLNEKVYLGLEELAGTPILVTHGSPTFVEFFSRRYADQLSFDTSMVGFSQHLKVLMKFVSQAIEK